MVDQGGIEGKAEQWGQKESGRDRDPAPNYMNTRWGVQGLELAQRIEVLKECREAQAELGQAVAQRRGWGAHLRGGLLVKQGGWN